MRDQTCVLYNGYGCILRRVKHNGMILDPSSLFLYLRIWLIIYPTCQKRLRSTHQQIFCPTPTPPLLDVQDYKWPYHHHQPEDNSLIRILLTQLEHLKFKKFHNILGKLEIKLSSSAPAPLCSNFLILLSKSQFRNKRIRADTEISVHHPLECTKYTWGIGICITL